jgi:hypothetical protein
MVLIGSVVALTKSLGVREDEIPVEVGYGKFLEGKLDHQSEKETFLAVNKSNSLFSSSLFVEG